MRCSTLKVTCTVYMNIVSLVCSILLFDLVNLRCRGIEIILSLCVVCVFITTEVNVVVN